MNILNEVLLMALLIISLAMSAQDKESLWDELMSESEILLQQGRYSETLKVAEEALKVAEKTCGIDHPNTAASMLFRGHLHRDQGKYAEAEIFFMQSLAIREKALGPDHPDVVESLSLLSEVYVIQRQFAAAELLFKRLYATKWKFDGPDVPSYSLHYLAFLHITQGRCAKAKPILFPWICGTCAQ